MKILIISDLYPPYFKGGYELRCKETAEEFIHRGHDVMILTSRWGIEGQKVDGHVHRLLFYDELIYPKRTVENRQIIHQGRGKLWSGSFEKIRNTMLSWLEVKPFRIRRRYYQTRWLINGRKNYLITRKLILATQPDLVFIWNMGLIGIQPILAAQNLKIPTVFSIGDYWLPLLKDELQGKNYLNRFTRIVTTGISDISMLNTKHLVVNSAVLYRDFVDKGFLPENINVISRGISSNLILAPSELGELPRKRNGGKIKLLYVGRVVDYKAPDVAIKALGILFTEFQISDIELEIVGQGPKDYVSTLENMVLELGLTNRVSFLGWLDHSKVLDLLLNYDVLIFPSRWVEPFGGTVMEAMARGLPVVSSKRGGPGEMITDGVNGLLVPVDNPAAFAEAILKLLQSDELTQNIRLAGLRTVNERYTLEHVVDQYLDYFQNILATNDGMGSQ